MVASLPSTENDRAARFARLMRLGQVSFAEGNRRQAHRFWRRAAMINPTDEQVWVALLNVLEDPEDRRVCLQNIVAINPNNPQAQQQLNDFFDDTVPALPVYLDGGEDITPRYLVRRAIEIGMFGSLIAVGITAARFMYLTQR